MSAARRSWELPVLLLCAAGLALPDLMDLDAFKGGALALVAAAVLVPWLLWKGLDDAGAWLSGIGPRLLLVSIAWSLLPALPAFRHATVVDRLLVIVLCQVAAVLGLRAARTAPAALGDAMLGVTMLVAVMALLQAAGVERSFNAGLGEVVSLMGNTTRAGALLALGVVAAFATATRRDLDVREWRVRVALAALLLGTAALVLTRARGGWIAAAGGLLAVALTTRGEIRARLKLWLPRVLVGLLLAVLLSNDGWHVLTAAKLPPATTLGASAPGEPGAPLGDDVTAQVRLSVWRACGPMIAARPLEGFGLGRFRESFPPWRDPAEAALPGLGGARTEVDHPHNEFVLAFTEGGAPAGLCLLAFIALTLARAVRRARSDDGDGRGDVLVLGVLVAGTLAALVQNAWTSPGTALPVFAAAGWVWRPDVEVSLAAATRGALTACLLALVAGLVLLAMPRLDSQWLLRRFLLASRDAVTRDTIPLLVRAADADPGDVNAQRVLLFYGGQFPVSGPGSVGPELAAALIRAHARLVELAPYAADVAGAR